MPSLSLDLYRKLYLIRQAEARIITHYPEDEMRTPMHMSMGQEAVAVGLGHALGEAGQVFGSYRSHALFLAKTGDPKRFFGELYGRTTGTAAGKAGSMHLAAPDRGLMAASAVVGSQIPAAVGLAFANQQLKTGRPTAVIFGDGGLECGDFWESLNAACVLRVPVLFVCEDNEYAVHSPKAVRHGFAEIEEVVRRFRCAVPVKGAGATDVERVWEAVVHSLAAAARGPQPAFLRVRTCRYLDHIGIEEDFEAGYRTRGEVEAWRALDPLARQRRRLLEQGLVEEFIAAEERAIDAQIDEALRVAQAAPAPSPYELYMGVFHDPGAGVGSEAEAEAEREWRAYEALE